MRRLEKDWFLDLAVSNEDLSKIKPLKQTMLIAPPQVAEEIPPFKGISRQEMSKAEASIFLGMSVNALHSRIKERLIFPRPRGRLVKIPIEECENYLERERLRYMARHA